jgi:hypothetical protein
MFLSLPLGGHSPTRGPRDDLAKNQRAHKTEEVGEWQTHKAPGRVDMRDCTTRMSGRVAGPGYGGIGAAVCPAGLAESLRSGLHHGGALMGLSRRTFIRLFEHEAVRHRFGAPRADLQAVLSQHPHSARRV